jgi:tRNA (adenine57-N1/adenine58-N1)-methyltransferase
MFNMNVDNYASTAKYGDLVLLVGPNKKRHIINLKQGAKLHTHRGTVVLDNLIGSPWGSEVKTNTGGPFYLLKPSIYDLIMEIPRTTQIMYPKDIGFILVRMEIGAGNQVLEAGTGSGALTTVLAWAVGDKGRVFSYENREDNLNLARKNLTRIGYESRVELKLQDIKEGFNERYVDSIFFDIHNAYDFINFARSALKPGGHLGSLMPTMNQVSRLIETLSHNNFILIDVCEIILRFYKPVPARLRPSDRMVAHTGYLIFSRLGV